MQKKFSEINLQAFSQSKQKMLISNSEKQYLKFNNNYLNYKDYEENEVSQEINSEDNERMQLNELGSLVEDENESRISNSLSSV